MSSVSWLCLLGLVLAMIAVVTSYVAIGAMGLVMFPLFAWFDWRRFGVPPSGGSPRWWWRFGPTRGDDDGGTLGFRGEPRSPWSGPSGGRGGGSKVPAQRSRGPRRPAGAQALPLPED